MPYVAGNIVQVHDALISSYESNIDVLIHIRLKGEVGAVKHV